MPLIMAIGITIIGTTLGTTETATARFITHGTTITILGGQTTTAITTTTTTTLGTEEVTIITATATETIIETATITEIAKQIQTLEIRLHKHLLKHKESRIRPITKIFKTTEILLSNLQDGLLVEIIRLIATAHLTAQVEEQAMVQELEVLDSKKGI